MKKIFNIVKKIFQYLITDLYTFFLKRYKKEQEAQDELIQKYYSPTFSNKEKSRFWEEYEKKLYSGQIKLILIIILFIFTPIYIILLYGVKTLIIILPMYWLILALIRNYYNKNKK